MPPAEVTDIHPAATLRSRWGSQPATTGVRIPRPGPFFAPNERIVALPSWHGSRLYIPLAGGIAQRWQASAMYPGNSHLARIAGACIRLIGALGLGPRAVYASGGSRAIYASGESLLGDFLSDVLPTAAAVSVLVRADATPRVTVEVRNRIGQVLGYLKYADCANARRRITQEHTVLASGLALQAPRVIKFGPLGTGYGLLISPLFGRRFWPVLPPPPMLVAFSYAHTVSGPVPLHRHPWFRYMREKTDAESDALFARLDERSWPVAVHHGDLVPSNLRIAGGRIHALDWECGTCEGFPYLDLIQYVLLIMLMIRRRAPSVAARHAARWVQGLGLSASNAQALTRLAALNRYVIGREDGELEDSQEQQTWRAVAALPC